MPSGFYNTVFCILNPVYPFASVSKLYNFITIIEKNEVEQLLSNVDDTIFSKSMHACSLFSQHV